MLLPDNSYHVLGMHKCDYHQADNPLDWCRSAKLREQLVAEIQALEQRLAAISEEHEAGIDYSLQQTCKEMIHSRQQLYLQLQR